MQSLKQVQILSGHSDRVWCVSWNPEGNLLASCSGDKNIKIWAYSSSIAKWDCVYTERDKHNRTIRCISWSPCGTFLASAGFDGVVNLWRIECSQNISLNLVADLTSHNYEVKGVSFSSSGRLLGTCARDKTVHVFEVDDDGTCEYAGGLANHQEDVKTVCWHPKIELLVSGSYDNTIKVYKEEYDEWELTATLSGHTSTVWKIAFNSVGDILASCSDDKTIRLWVPLDNEFSKWANGAVLTGYHDRVVYDISWASSLNLLSSVSRDNSVCVFRIGEVDRIMSGDVGSGVDVELLTRVKQAHDEDINTCSWRHDRMGETMILATGSDDCLIKLWKFSDPDLPID